MQSGFIVVVDQYMTTSMLQTSKEEQVYPEKTYKTTLLDLALFASLSLDLAPC